jgi:hypothetical protein
MNPPSCECLLTCLSAQCENRNLVLRSDDCQLAYQGICGKIFNALDERERELAIYCVGTMVVHHHPLSNNGRQ